MFIPLQGVNSLHLVDQRDCGIIKTPPSSYDDGGVLRQNTVSAAVSEYTPLAVVCKKKRHNGGKRNCERGGTRTRNQWLKRPLLYH